MPVVADKVQLANKVRDLRLARRWTQSELASQLGLSQSRLSEIERGAGSFTAEQFLTILALFNVTTDHFVSIRPDPEASLQNALARLGATHLRESDQLPSERLREAETVLREVLVAPESPRLITALAPVLVQNVSALPLLQLSYRLADLGISHRLGWLIENTIAALQDDLPRTHGKRRNLYRRAQVPLGAALKVLQELKSRSNGPRLPDVLDQSIRSDETLAEVQRASSPISKRWSIASELKPDDFAEALRGARAAD